MIRRVPHIPQRRVIYVGCEGSSEEGYARLLQEIAAAQGLGIHLKIDVLHPGAGDPLARMEMAVQRLERLRRTRGAPAERFIFLDFDQAARDPQRAQRAIQLAARHNISIVWQRPAFEATLLRHLPNRADRQPPDTPAALQALRREWPDYQKPMTARDLAARIDLGCVLRAAAVEPELQVFLRCLGLIGNP